jgi:hypothetical protein
MPPFTGGQSVNRTAVKLAGVLPVAVAVAVALAAPARAQVEEAAPAASPAAEAPDPHRWRVSLCTGVGGIIPWVDLLGAGLGGGTQTDFHQVGVRVDGEAGRASFGLGYTRQHWRDVGPSPGDDMVSTVDLLVVDARAR